MPTLYLIDAHSNVLSSSKINDTVNVAPGYTETRSLRGSFPITLPFDVPLDGTPSDLADLITKKYAGMLSLYPGYQNILYDEQIDAGGWTITSSMAGFTVGERQSTSSYTNASQMMSVTTVLASTPTIACFRWEAFEILYDDSTGVTGARSYREADPASWKVLASFNGGSTYTELTSGMIFSIPLADQGSSFRLILDRASLSPQRAYLGSWALVY